MLPISAEPTEWMERAPCRGWPRSELFVPRTDSMQIRKRWVNNPPDQLIAMCGLCPVHIECFRHGIRTKSNGWWGGVLLHNGRLVQDDGHVTLKRRGRRAAPGEGLAYFEAEFERDIDECQLWPHGRSTGYGQVMLGRRTVYVHILSCELAHGPRPDGYTAQHTCGQRACFNKRHLYWGPATSPTARLTPDQVREIRRQRTAGVRRDDVAKEFDLAPNTVSVIMSGRRWASIQ